jgi:drug/metabolite transporter (DMT)-like permease
MSDSASPPVAQTMQPREWLLLFLLSLLWGGSFFFNKVVLHDLPPLTVVCGRTGLAAMILLLYLACRGESMPRSWRHWRAFWVMGLLNNLLPFSLIVWGQQYIDSGVAAILNATTPLFTVLLAHWFTATERLTLHRLAGVLLGFVGVVFLMGLDKLPGQQNLGQFAVLGAAFSYACAGIYGRRFQSISPTVAATGMLISTTCTLLPVALVVEQPWQFYLRPVAGLALLGLGLLSTAIAYQIYFHILAVAGATNLLLVTFLIPLSALLLGTTFLQEPLQPIALMGMGLIMTGLSVMDGRWLRCRNAEALKRDRSESTKIVKNR